MISPSFGDFQKSRRRIRPSSNRHRSSYDDDGRRTATRRTHRARDANATERPARASARERRRRGGPARESIDRNARMMDDDDDGDGDGDDDGDERRADARDAARDDARGRAARAGG